METQRQRNRERQNDRETCRDRERETTKCKPDDIYNSEQFWLNTIMKDIVEPSRLRLAHASGARSGWADPSVCELAAALTKLLGQGSAGRLWGGPACTFSRQNVAVIVARLVAWPCGKAPGRSRWCICSFAHCLWIVASPSLQWIAHTLDRDEPLPWSPKLQACSDSLHEDFVGIDDEAEGMSIQAMASFASMLMESHLEVKVDLASVSAVMLTLVRSGLPSGAVSVYLVLLSSHAMESMIGSTLHNQLVCCLLAAASHLPMPAPLESVAAGTKRELLQALAAQHSRGTEWEAHDVLVGGAPPTKKSRKVSKITEASGQKTEVVRLALVNKVSLTHLVNTALDFERLRQKFVLQGDGFDSGFGKEDLFGRRAIARHMLILDSALDSRQKDELLEERARCEPGTFAVALATDESPPSQRRFGGYRFQVTMAYLPKWHPMETWDASLTPPLDVAPRLLDICHCPGKNGPSVMKVLDKQLQRLGLSRYDVVSLVGDGGGENEGLFQGMHKILEDDVPGFVRRRCLGHLAWRVADAVIAVVPAYKQIKKLAEYLGSGVTWTRLQAIACTPLIEHGLGLFRQGTRPCVQVFGKTPPGIFESRPESDFKFLRFLQGKEHVLSLAATIDVNDRELCAKTEEAVNLLAHNEGRAQRRVCAEVLRRALFLHHWVNDHPHISGISTLEDLADRAQDHIQDLSLDPNTIMELGFTQEQLDAKGWSPATWVDLAVILEYDDEGAGAGSAAKCSRFPPGSGDEGLPT